MCSHGLPLYPSHPYPSPAVMEQHLHVSQHVAEGDILPGVFPGSHTSLNFLPGGSPSVAEQVYQPPFLSPVALETSPPGHVPAMPKLSPQPMLSPLSQTPGSQSPPDLIAMSTPGTSSPTLSSASSRSSSDTLASAPPAGFIGGFTFIKEENRYSCLRCHYLTYRHEKIQQHMLAHQGNIVCQVCGKAFIKSCDLDRHMVAHAAGRLKPHNILPKVTAGAMKGTDQPPSVCMSELSMAASPATLSPLHVDVACTMQVAPPISTVPVMVADYKHEFSAGIPVGSPDDADASSESLLLSMQHGSEGLREIEQQLTAVVSKVQQELMAKKDATEQVKEDTMQVEKDKVKEKTNMAELKEGKAQDVNCMLQENKIEQDKVHGEKDKLQVQNDRLQVEKGKVQVEKVQMEKDVVQRNDVTYVEDLMHVENMAEVEDLPQFDDVALKEIALKKKDLVLEKDVAQKDMAMAEKDVGLMFEGTTQEKNGLQKNPEKDMALGKEVAQEKDVTQEKDQVWDKQQGLSKEENHAGWSKKQDREDCSPVDNSLQGRVSSTACIDSPDQLGLKISSVQTVQSDFLSAGDDGDMLQLQEQYGVPQHPIHSVSPRKTRSGDLVYRCSLCSYSTKDPWHLDKHYLAHTRDYKTCRYCRKAFERPSDLVRHEERHRHKADRLGFIGPLATGEKGVVDMTNVLASGMVLPEELPEFPRQEAMEVTPVIQSMLRRSSNTLESPAASPKIPGGNARKLYRTCDLCHYRFVSPVALQKHKKNIHGQGSPKKNQEQQISCDQCPAQFPSEALAQKHRNQVHADLVTRVDTYHKSILTVTDLFHVKLLSDNKIELMLDRPDVDHGPSYKVVPPVSNLADIRNILLQIKNSCQRQNIQLSVDDEPLTPYVSNGIEQDHDGVVLQDTGSAVDGEASGESTVSQQSRTRKQKYTTSPVINQEGIEQSDAVCLANMEDLLHPEVAIVPDARSFTESSTDNWKSAVPRSTECKYKCSLCSYSTNFHHKIYEHQQAHRGKFICKQCNKAFMMLADLTRHWVSHNIITEEGLLPCDTCKFVTTNTTTLEQHMKTHYKEAFRRRGFKHKMPTTTLADWDRSMQLFGAGKRSVIKLEPMEPAVPRPLQAEHVVVTTMEVESKGTEPEHGESKVVEHKAEKPKEGETQQVLSIIEKSMEVESEVAKSKEVNAKGAASKQIESIPISPMGAEPVPPLEEFRVQKPKKRGRKRKVQEENVTENDKTEGKKKSKKQEDEKVWKNTKVEVKEVKIIGPKESVMQHTKHEENINSKEELVQSKKQEEMGLAAVAKDADEYPEAYMHCPECDMGFLTRIGVARHRRMKHNVKMQPGQYKVPKQQGQTYSCKYCSKEFTHMEKYLKHERAHQERDKPSACEYCGKTFATAHYLKDHIRLHTGEKPYSCDKCGEKFGLNVYLYHHKKRKCKPGKPKTRTWRKVKTLEELQQNQGEEEEGTRHQRDAAARLVGTEYHEEYDDSTEVEDEGEEDEVVQKAKRRKVDNSDKAKRGKVDNSDKAKRGKVDNSDKAKKGKVDNSNKAKNSLNELRLDSAIVIEEKKGAISFSENPTAVIEGIHTCGECGKCFLTQTYLAEHSKRHKVPSDKHPLVKGENKATAKTDNARQTVKSGHQTVKSVCPSMQSDKPTNNGGDATKSSDIGGVSGKSDLSNYLT